MLFPCPRLTHFSCLGHLTKRPNGNWHTFQHCVNLKIKMGVTMKPCHNMVYCIQDTHNDQHRSYVHWNYEQSYQFNTDKNTISSLFYFITLISVKTYKSGRFLLSGLLPWINHLSLVWWSTFKHPLNELCCKIKILIFMPDNWWSW